MKLSQVYLKAFEEDCLELIVNAYTVAVSEKKYQANWVENDFSELLRYYVNQSQLSIEKGITCKTEDKLLLKTDSLVKGFADRLPRIDFVYFKIWRKQRFQCYMEAKRLKYKDPDLKRAYISDGMDRYISEKYPVGCMLGYLLEGSSEETIEGINMLLEKDGRNSETLVFKSTRLLKSYCESNHSGIGVLKHLTFDFTNI